MVSANNAAKGPEGLGPSPISARRRWLFRLALALALFLIAEVASYICLCVLNRRYPMDPMAGIVPERVNGILFNCYDPDLGWVYAENRRELNFLGARSSHEYPDVFRTISVYGDSYAFGAQVPVEDAWAC